MTTEKKFLDPHDPSLDIPGTEDWREMYPYHTFFHDDDRERCQFESEVFWCYDALHRPEPIPPFDLIWEDARNLSMGMMTRYMVVPHNAGMSYRIVNGYCYIGGHKFDEPEVIRKRAVLFEERAAHYYGHWEDLYDKKWHQKVTAVIDELKQITFPDLPEVEDIGDVKEGRGLTSAHPIMEAYYKMLNLAYRAWDYHFEFMSLGYGGILQYIETMKTLFPDISDKSISKTTMGFDAAIFRPPQELQKLAISAVESGLGDILLSGRKWQKIAPKLQQTESGRIWLEQFGKARDPWFEMSGGTGWYHTDGCWNDNLDLPLAHIRNYMEALKRGEPIMKPQEEIIQERDRVTAEYRGLIQNDQDRQAFNKSLALARLVAPFAEDHNFYCDNWFHCLFYRKMRELGTFLVKYGPLEDREDIFFFNTFEIPNVIFDILTKWHSYLAPIAKTYWPAKIKRRKEILERFREWTPPPALGVVPPLPLDPVLITLHGVVEETIKEWLEAEEAQPQEVNELKGIAGSGGVVEGIARVCRTALDITTLRAGEILVAPTTSPTWAPSFKIINGAVIDQGGLFAHAAIVCREYGLPAVMGTTNGTRVINTGDKIRVDGDNGVVTVLERA